MWFRKQLPSKSELKPSDHASGSGRRRTGVSSELPMSTYPVDELVNGGPSTLPPQGPLDESTVQSRRRSDSRLEGKPYAGGPRPAGGIASKGDSAYRFIRTQILQRLRENDWRTVAVTSPSRKSGTTLTTINLAIRIARTFNHAVLLVELDLVNPSFHKLLGFTPGKGVVDYLRHDVPISEIERDLGIGGLVVIPAGAPVSYSSELLSSPKMARLVEELKRRYQHEIILFDLPAILSSDDAAAFSPFADCSLLVVEEDATRISEVRQALDYLRSTNMLGIVLNQSIHVMTDGRATPD